MSWSYKIFWSTVVILSLFLTACGKQKTSDNTGRRNGTASRTATSGSTGTISMSEPISKFGITGISLQRVVFGDNTVTHELDAVVNGKAIIMDNTNNPYYNGVSEIVTNYLTPQRAGGFHTYIQTKCVNEECSFSVFNILIVHPTTSHSKQFGAIVDATGRIPTNGSYEGIYDGTTNSMLDIVSLESMFYGDYGY